MITVPVIACLSFVCAVLATPVIKKDENALQWRPCQIDLGDLYNDLITVNYSCATLQVPLDYTNDSSSTLLLPLIKVNATKGPHLGSVLFNPGGPGGSGILDVALTGGLYRTVTGGQYDLIGFDPRGTGRTIPFDCLAWGSNDTTDGPTRRDILPEDDLTDLLYDWGWDASTHLSDRCADIQAEKGRFLSTAFVARDMLEIVEAVEGDGLLRYWGLSYGTMLGNTFAAMFPNRIDRMFLDSVVNPLDYMAGYWLTALEDTDSVFLGFLDECVKAGPELCAIANFSGPSTTAEDLLQLTNNMFQYLLDNPQSLGANVTSALWAQDVPGTVYANLKGFIFSALYSPSIWGILASLAVGPLALDFSVYTEDIPDAPSFVDTYNLGVDSFWGIACSDSSYRVDSPEEMGWLVEAQQNVSSFSDALATQIWPCYQWKLPAAERYTGSFQANTSHPILYVNGIADPVTPLASARNASAGFPGSVVLSHGGYGHGFYSDPSLCVARAIRTYFVNGTLPAEGTHCEADFGSFELPNSLSISNGSYFDGIQKRGSSAYSDDDRELLQAMTSLREHSQCNGRGGPLRF